MILRDWKEKQDTLKEFMGVDYIDYNLVLAQKPDAPVRIALLEINSSG